jgi:signal transduction histidine kinase
MLDTKASILIVDDRPEKLLALEAVLEDLNQNIVRAYSGREALRHVLDNDFAVILLDVNMPGMDGFETATMIRQRQNSQHIPIIFITAFGDEMHAARGYSLGAVDYILAPVLPDVLRTKVAVFVDLYRKTEQTNRQAESLRRRAAQLQKLAAASVAINSALSIEQMMQVITDTARDIVGAHQAIILFLPRNVPAHCPSRTLSVASFSNKYADWRGRRLNLDAIASTLVAQKRTATRLTAHDLRNHPDWEIVRDIEIPPIGGGMLATPLTGRDGTNFGVLYLADRLEDDFSDNDEAILVQLAQMASIAIENSLYAEEREANRLKDEFLATLSHELRTPLNAILGWTQLLQMEGAKNKAINGDDEAMHALEVIERNARSQTKLIEDLLDVSRITTGKLRINVTPVKLGPIVTAALDAVRPAVEARRITLVARLEAGDISIPGDPDRLQQVFWNLLTNASKFTPPDGRIEVLLEDTGEGSVRLSVGDSGAGIDPRFLPFVFDRFRQADSSSTRSHGGLGIGLTIVRHIIELHGGAVSAESEGEGLGSVFSVTLPLTGGCLPAPAAQELDALEQRSAAIGAARSAQQEPADLSGLRVLLVDDEPDAREVISEILKRYGAAVTTAASAREALAALRGKPFDIVCSDIAMPDEDGYFFIRSLRGLAVDEGGITPAVALTAYAREEDRRRALAAGFQSHLAKPIDPNELATVIFQFASVRAINDENGDRETIKLQPA